MSAKSPIALSLLLFGAAIATTAALSGLSGAVQESSAPAVRTNDERQSKAALPTDASSQELFSGKVVVLQDALKRRGVNAYDEFNSQVALETIRGELIPIVPDWRGRAFYQDKRLRDRRVDLIGTRHKAAPYLQVLTIFVFDEKDARQYMDYWCDICAIPMYEIKPCDCCQADIRLRFQPQDLPDFVRKPANR